MIEPYESLAPYLTTPREEQPSLEFPRKVFTTDAEILASNKAIYDLRNLTAHYFHDKPGPNGGTYDTRYVSTERFRRNWFDHVSVPYEFDRNHDTIYRLQTADIEMGWCEERDTTHPDWPKQIGAIQQCCQMMRAAGRYAALYENWYYEFTHPYWASRYRQRGNLTKMMSNIEAMDARWGKDHILASKFRPHVDAHTFKLYCAYNINESPRGGEMWQAWMDVMQWHVQKAKTLYPNVPCYAWVQANYPSDNFEAMSSEVWQDTLDFLMQSRVDGICLFIMYEYPKPENFRSYFAA